MSTIIITIMVYSAVIMAVVFLLKNVFKKPEIEIPREVLQKLAGERYWVVPKKSYTGRIYRGRRDENICSEYKSGISIKEISSQYKLSHVWIWRILKGNNIEIRGRWKRDKSRNSRIKEMVKIGLNKCEIARRENISRQRVYNNLKKEMA